MTSAMSIDLDILVVPTTVGSSSGSEPSSSSTSGRSPVDTEGRSFADHLDDAGNSGTPKATTASKTSSTSNTSKPAANNSKPADKSDQAPSKTAADDKTSSEAKTDKTDSTAKDDDATASDSSKANSKEVNGQVALNDVSGILNNKSGIAVAATDAAQANANKDSSDTSGDNPRAEDVSSDVLKAVQDARNAKNADASQQDKQNNGLHLGQTKTGSETPNNTASKPSGSSEQQITSVQAELVPTPKSSTTSKLEAAASPTATADTKAPASQTSSVPPSTDSARAATNPVKPETLAKQDTTAKPETQAPAPVGKGTEPTPPSTDGSKAIALSTDADAVQPPSVKADTAKARSDDQSGSKSGGTQTADTKSQGQSQSTAATPPSADAIKPLTVAQRQDTPLPVDKPDSGGQTQTPGQSSTALTLPDQTAALAQLAQANTATAHAKMMMSIYSAGQNIGQQVAVQITKAALDGLNRFSIQLHPADLGRVDVRLDMSHDGHVTAMVTADRHDTLNLLQRDARSLERSLQDMGLKMDAGGMQFSLKDQGNARGEPGQPDMLTTGADVPVSAPDLEQTVIAAAATTVLGNRMLDIRV